MVPARLDATFEAQGSLRSSVPLAWLIVVGAATMLNACESGPAEPEPIPSVDRPLLFADGIDAFVAADTGGATLNLTANEDMRVAAAEWSPIGTHIAYFARPDTQGGRYQLHVMAGDASGSIQVSDVQQAARQWVAWSPDGGRIAFGAGTDLFVVPRDGSEGQRELTPGEQTGLNPDWSPDGAWIVYQGQDEGGVAGIYRIRPDGSDRTLLIDLGWDSERRPRYSPEGDSIVFERDEALHLIGADGGDPRQLTFGESDRYARWSPDGTTIAYVTDGGAHWAIGLVDVATSTFLGQIGHPSFDAEYPVWSPDGTRVAFQQMFSISVADAVDGGAWESIARGAFVSWHPGG